MLGVEILPSELPRDASEHFGRQLMPLLLPILTSKGLPITQNTYPSSFTNIALVEDSLPSELKRACIVSNGHLLPKWAYITRLREQTQSTSIAAKSSVALSLDDRYLFVISSPNF